jgi:hypothetical protein
MKVKRDLATVVIVYRRVASSGWLVAVFSMMLLAIGAGVTGALQRDDSNRLLLAQSPAEKPLPPQRKREAVAGQGAQADREGASRTRSIDWERNVNGHPSAVVVQGLTEQELRSLGRLASDDERWSGILPVGVATSNPLAPMLGSYHVVGTRVRFEPRYPFRSSLPYRAVFYATEVPDAAGVGLADVSADYQPVAPVASPATRVAAIYPSADVLPENQLKFYLYFSSPMSRGEAYRRVKLLDMQGVPVEYPFLELGEELWNPQGTRFTLFLDPGRIKRGLQPRELFGPALEEGSSYTLEVSASWPDAQGRPLHETVRKKFRVAAPDDVQPNVRQWRVTTPPSGTLQPLHVRFPEPLDQAMLQRVVRVLDRDFQLVPGTISVTDRETCWSWTPIEPWKPGRHWLRADGNLEDLAGNSLERPFEVDQFDRVERQVEETVVDLPFDVVTKP